MLNNAILMGRLVADPEFRTTGSGLAVTKFTIAVERPWIKKKEPRQANFIDIIAWRKTAEFVSKYFQKGSMIAVEGGIQTGSYTDKEGIKRRSFSISASQVHFCGSKKDSPGTTESPEPLPQNFDNTQPGDFEEVTDDELLPF